MIVWSIAFSAGATRLCDSVCIVESNKTLISRAVKRERIPDAVWPFWSRSDKLDLKFHPETSFMNNVGVAIESQQIFKSVIRLPAHNKMLSESDNSTDIIFSCSENSVPYCKIGIPAILACHSLGPVWWTEVPWLSTATVTGMSLTSNS